MTYELIAGLSSFALVSSLTPGPNNLMLMTSGANFGFGRTIPHMLGVSIGFTLMVLLVGIGLMQLFNAYPLSHSILKVVSVVYLVYLALKIATAGRSVASGEKGARPLTFLQAALFQWVNPKAWTMALTAVSIYSPSSHLASVAFVAVLFGLINLPSVSMWTLLGQQLQLLLTNPLRLRVFNVSMALLLLGSLYPVLAPA